MAACSARVAMSAKRKPPRLCWIAMATLFVMAAYSNAAVARTFCVQLAGWQPARSVANKIVTLVDECVGRVANGPVPSIAAVARCAAMKFVTPAKKRVATVTRANVVAICGWITSKNSGARRPISAPVVHCVARAANNTVPRLACVVPAGNGSAKIA